MTTKNKKCEYCEEEYREDLFFNFTIQNSDSEGVEGHESGVCCADCISAWFAEDPEAIKNMMIWKVA